ncbi:MAG: hypothetical protein HS104_41790 [Polyangiaceae bacterium]|nr:hypothetical protein [Polyangiaceae bacterium]MCL4751603.1 hypothetical protein [Myxococcales bacterium]
MKPSHLAALGVSGLALALLPLACGSSDEGGGSSGGGGAPTGGSGGSAGSGGGSGGNLGGSGGVPEDAGGDGACPTPCTAPGTLCVSGACLSDCRLPGAVPCAAGDVCDVGSEHPGQCVTPGSGCVVTSLPEACPKGDGGSVTCGPGTRCDGDGGCYAALPCKSVSCKDGSCWGTDCSCTRPAPACAPAPLGKLGDAGTLNDPKFIKCGTLSSCDGGIFDLDFDQKCGAWGVTMISGTDYLRHIDAAGKVTEYAGVTNLNMGEVAAIQGESGVFGGGLTDVALTYICCATCGCILSGSGGNPQGVAALDPQNGSLPMKIPTTQFSSGAGPFGIPTVDTGPYGLSWGLDRVLYVGNVQANGDYHALDLTAQTSQQVGTFAKRVLASAPFDKARMLVGLEGGEVQLAPVLGGTGTPKPLITLPAHMTSLVRDSWSGRVYAELSDKSIVSFSEDGKDLKTFQTAPALGRITIAPDGYLYHLTVGWPTTPEVVRWQLPTTL